MPYDPVSENTQEVEKRSDCAIVSWFESHKDSSMTAKRFFELAGRGWTIPSTDEEASG